MSESPVRVQIDCICGAEKTESMEKITMEYMKDAYCAQCGRMIGELWAAALKDLGIVSIAPEPPAADPTLPPEAEEPKGPPSEQVILTAEELNKHGESTVQAIMDLAMDYMKFAPPMPQSAHFALIYKMPGEAMPQRFAVSYRDHGDLTNGMVRLQRLAMTLAAITAQCLQATPDAFSRNAARQQVAQILAPVLMPEGNILDFPQK